MRPRSQIFATAEPLPYATGVGAAGASVNGAAFPVRSGPGVGPGRGLPATWSARCAGAASRRRPVAWRALVLGALALLTLQWLIVSFPARIEDDPSGIRLIMIHALPGVAAVTAVTGNILFPAAGAWRPFTHQIRGKAFE